MIAMGSKEELYVKISFFFQAEDGIRGAQESRGLGDVYKRQMPGEHYRTFSDASGSGRDYCRK